VANGARGKEVPVLREEGIHQRIDGSQVCKLNWIRRAKVQEGKNEVYTGSRHRNSAESPDKHVPPVCSPARHRGPWPALIPRIEHCWRDPFDECWTAWHKPGTPMYSLGKALVVAVVAGRCGHRFDERIKHLSYHVIDGELQQPIRNYDRVLGLARDRRGIAIAHSRCHARGLDRLSSQTTGTKSSDQCKYKNGYRQPIHRSTPSLGPESGKRQPSQGGVGLSPRLGTKQNRLGQIPLDRAGSSIQKVPLFQCYERAQFLIGGEFSVNWPKRQSLPRHVSPLRQ